MTHVTIICVGNDKNMTRATTNSFKSHKMDQTQQNIGCLDIPFFMYM